MAPMRTPSCACLLAGCGPVAASHVARMAFLCRADHSRASLRLSQTSAFPFGKFRASLEAVLCRNLPAPGHALQLPAVPLLSPTPPARAALLPSAWPAPPLPVWPLNTLTMYWMTLQCGSQHRPWLRTEKPWEGSLGSARCATRKPPGRLLIPRRVPPPCSFHAWAARLPSSGSKGPPSGTNASTHSSCAPGPVPSPGKGDGPRVWPRTAHCTEAEAGEVRERQTRL